MQNYVVKIPLRDMSLAEAKNITSAIYELIDEDEDIPGTAGAVYLTEGMITADDEQQDMELESAFEKHYRSGINKNPLPDDFPVID